MASKKTTAAKAIHAPTVIHRKPRYSARNLRPQE